MPSLFCRPAYQFALRRDADQFQAGPGLKIYLQYQAYSRSIELVLYNTGVEWRKVRGLHTRAGARGEWHGLRRRNAQNCRQIFGSAE